MAEVQISYKVHDIAWLFNDFLGGWDSYFRGTDFKLNQKNDREKILELGNSLDNVFPGFKDILIRKYVADAFTLEILNDYPTIGNLGVRAIEILNDYLHAAQRDIFHLRLEKAMFKSEGVALPDSVEFISGLAKKAPHLGEQINEKSLYVLFKNPDFKEFAAQKLYDLLSKSVRNECQELLQQIIDKLTDEEHLIRSIDFGLPKIACRMKAIWEKMRSLYENFILYSEAVPDIKNVLTLLTLDFLSNSKSINKQFRIYDEEHVIYKTRGRLKSFYSYDDPTNAFMVLLKSIRGSDFKKCPWCEKIFYRAHGGRIYCSDRCSNNFRQQKLKKSRQ